MHKFSIVIATWNRQDALKKALFELSKQGCRDFETIVVDNGSTDATAQAIEKDHPEVKLVRLERNLGVEAYNIGLRKADSEYIIFMDNDAYLKESALNDLAEAFARNKDAQVIALNIIDFKTGESETDGLRPDSCVFHGAAVAMEKSVADALGGYDKDYFIMHTDLELSTRILNNGYSIYYDKDIIAFHSRSEVSRLGSTAIFYATRNALFYYWKYYPYSYAFILSLREVVYGSTRALREGSFRYFLKGLFFGLISITHAINSRVPLKRDVFLRMKQYIDSSFRRPIIKKALSRFKNYE